MRNLRYILLAVCFPMLVQAALSPYEQKCEHFLHSKGQQSESERFSQFLKFQWKYQMTTYPEFATYAGYPGQNDRWTDMSRQAIDLRKRELKCPVRAMQSISRARLSPKDQLNYDLFTRDAKLNLEDAQFPDELLPISQMGGVHQDAASMLASMPAQSAHDYEDIISRLEKLPPLIEQNIELLKEGVQRNVVLPKVILRDVPQQILNLLPKDVEKSALYLPFVEMRAQIPEVEQKTLRTRAKEVIGRQVYPAFQKLLDYFVAEYLPHTREKIAWETLPNGKSWYAYLVRVSTTTDMTPEEIHQLGLSEVKRIHGEMEEVVAKSGFKGNLQQFAKYLRTDPQFYYQSADELLRGYRDIAKRIDPELAHLFGKLPRNPYGVKAIPSFAEKSQPTAYYEGGSVKAGRPGYFMANTYDLKTRPKWEMEALTAHEAVPGHHLQISLAQEMEGVPEFRKLESNTAFIEGWGLYAESLGLDIGLYKNTYSNFGRLTYEMWRACRLVVDTGMHHMGWSRDQAIQYMMTNTAKTPHDIEVEVDRYIAWPGQALAYKIGELTFKRLRAEATKRLGNRFDIRKFHDQVLSEGALPMDMLETRTHAWIKKNLEH